MPRCTGCHDWVSRDFARVFGDNHDKVHACPNCTARSRGVDTGKTARILNNTI